MWCRGCDITWLVARWCLNVKHKLTDMEEWCEIDRCVDTEERKWDGGVKLWWTAQCWSAVLKSDSESSTQEIVLRAAPVNENNEWRETRQEWVWAESHVRPGSPCFVQSCMVTLTLPWSAWTLKRKGVARWAPAS